MFFDVVFFLFCWVMLQWKNTRGKRLAKLLLVLVSERKKEGRVRGGIKYTRVPNKLNLFTNTASIYFTSKAIKCNGEKTEPGIKLGSVARHYFFYESIVLSCIFCDNLNLILKIFNLKNHLSNNDLPGNPDSNPCRI